MKAEINNNSMVISFIGEVMLGREVGEKYEKEKYPLIEDALKDRITNADFVVANLEAPIAGDIQGEEHIMIFNAKPEILEQVDFVDAFSLANNHINDVGVAGIEKTIEHLENKGFTWNGFYEQEYEPILFEKNDIKCAVICCTDILNEEITDKAYRRNLLWLDNEIIDKKIAEYKNKGYFVIMYVHGGIMFSRYPNPPFRKILHNKIDKGTDCIITAHPHVLGCMETYNGKNIFYSLGDFIMDGHSDRRREAGVLKVTINQKHDYSYELIPTFISDDLVTVSPKGARLRKIEKSWNSVSNNLAKQTGDYDTFYKKKFKKELMGHIISTLKYQLQHQSPAAIIKTVFTRAKDFKNMGRWVMKDTSKMRNNLEDESML
jgi:poly-gamma-glutamate synthesis protein (capsule biosynthesis protein)